MKLYTINLQQQQQIFRSYLDFLIFSVAVALDCEPTFDSRASPINNAINLLIGRRVQPLAKSTEAGQDIPAQAYCVSLQEDAP